MKKYKYMVYYKGKPVRFNLKKKKKKKVKIIYEDVFDFRYKKHDNKDVIKFIKQVTCL